MSSETRAVAILRLMRGDLGRGWLAHAWEGVDTLKRIDSAIAAVEKVLRVAPHGGKPRSKK